MSEDEIRSQAVWVAILQRLSATNEEVANLKGELAVMQDRYNKAQAEILELKTPKPVEVLPPE